MTSGHLVMNGKSRKKMEKKNYKLNQNKLRVKKCCASCMHKDLEGNLTDCVNHIRWCSKNRMTVLNDECCEDWKINREIDMAGGGEPGRVKKAEYITWFGATWPKLQALGWTAQQARDQWEIDNGTSVYM